MPSTAFPDFLTRDASVIPPFAILSLVMLPTTRPRAAEIVARAAR